MKNKKTFLALAGGLAILFLIFAWLFWGSTMPDPTAKNKKTESPVKATVYNTVLDRKEDGKKVWELRVEEATQVNEDLITAKKLSGTVYLSDGDEMYVTASGGKVRVKTNDFTLNGKVTARLKNGGRLKADTITWIQKKDILTAKGAVQVVKDDMLAAAEQVITSSKLEHFKLKDKAHVERGGTYDEK